MHFTILLIKIFYFVCRQTFDEFVMGKDIKQEKCKMERMSERIAEESVFLGIVVGGVVKTKVLNMLWILES